MQRVGLAGLHSSLPAANSPILPIPSLRKCKKQARRIKNGDVSTHLVAGKRKVDKVLSKAI